MHSAPAIDVADLRKTYTTGVLRRKQFPALASVSFSVRPGEIFGLLGQNGAGKTTFIKILLGIIRKSAGRAELLGQPAGKRSARRLVGYLPENLRVPRHLTGYTALELYGQLSGLSVREVVRRRGEILERVGLVERAKDSVTTYSKGMLQRLGLAQAMLHDPQVYILDEPTDGLDPIARQQVRRTLSELKRQGKTIFLNSHILQEVELICDRVAILDRGRLKFCGPVTELTSSGAVGAEDGVTVVWELVAEESALREAFTLVRTDRWTPLGSDRWEVSSRLARSSDIDGVLDALRGRGVSVQGIRPERSSLEDAYVQIVAEAVE